MEDNKSVAVPQDIEEESDRFPELTEKQRNFLNDFLLVGFSKKLWEIPNSLDFVEGRTDEMSFGMFSIKRIGLLEISVSSEMNYHLINIPVGTRSITTKEFNVNISLPHS